MFKCKNRKICLVSFIVGFLVAVWVAQMLVNNRISLNTVGVLIDTPKVEAVVTSPLYVKGSAPGSWFFEASFPVTLTNWDGLIIAEGIAQAKGDWMTEKNVPFEATLEFERPKDIQGVVNRGFLILKKDNPSGLPQNDAYKEIEVRF